jgi:hypothetical protein
MYDRELQRQRFEILHCNHLPSVFYNINIFNLLLKKHSGLLQRRCCSCKCSNRTIGSWILFRDGTMYDVDIRITDFQNVVKTTQQGLPDFSWYNLPKWEKYAKLP